MTYLSVLGYSEGDIVEPILEGDVTVWKLRRHPHEDDLSYRNRGIEVAERYPNMLLYAN